jgi:hypothetical protein
MKRRTATLVIAALFAAPLAFAHHGWSSFDSGAPLYLTGTIKKVSWRNPHAELVLEVDRPLRVPDDLKARAVPPQSAGVDGPAMLAKTAAPKRTDAAWTIELAPLTRMDAWKVPQLKAGEKVEVVGFTFPGEKGEAILRAEYLFHAGRAYGLRSSPVQ